MDKFLQALFGSSQATAKTDDSMSKPEVAEQQPNFTFPSQLVDDGGFTRNVLMKGVPGMETNSPPLTGINGNAWMPGVGQPDAEGKGPYGIPVSSDTLPPSPLNPETQSVMSAAKPQGMELPPAAPPTTAKAPMKPKAAPKMEAEQPVIPEPEAPEEEPKGPSILDKLMQDYMTPQKDEELSAAQQRRNEIQQQLAMLKSFEQIGAGLGGYNSDKDYLSEYNELAGQPVKDIEQRRDQERKMKSEKGDALKMGMDVDRFKTDSELKGIDLSKAKIQLKDAQANKDPNSEISKATREAILQRFQLAGAKVNIPQGLSAEQLKGMFPMGDIVDDLLKKQGVEAAAKERSAARKDAERFKKEGKLEDYTKDFRKELTSPSTIGGKAYSNFLNADKAFSAISTYSKDPSGYKDYASLMSALKALQGDESVVREAEIKLGMGAGSLMDSLNNTFSKAATGKMLQPKQRQQMMDAVSVLRETYRDQFNRAAAPTLEQAKHLGLDSSQILGQDFLNQPVSGSGPTKAQEVERKTKDGRIGIFDANTKQFLRYK